MAKLVEMIGVTHNPNLIPAFQENPDSEPGIRAALDNFGRMRQKLAEARPDVLIVIASDHFNQWFMDNMPAFIVGKAPSTHGPFPDKIAPFGRPYYAT